MSPDMKQLNRVEELIHERARTLAAETIDGPLAPDDETWLNEHLGGCTNCAAVAADYRAIRSELRGLTAPVPPRDLWARTSAALDAVDSKAGRKSLGRGSAARLGNRPLASTALAVGVVVVVAAVSIVQQSPLATPASASSRPSAIALVTVAQGHPSTAPQGPLAVVDGTRYWISSGSGVYEIKGSSTKCVTANGSCSVAGGSGQTLSSIASASEVSAAIAPDAARAAVWSKNKIAIVPLTAMPHTVSLDQLTPRPTAAPTPTAPAATEMPESTPAETPQATPTPTPAPSAALAPIAILSGYEIVGRDPEFSADGTLLAFAARPADHSTGPDVFVWRVGQQQAKPVTSRHADVLAGWYGSRILISEIVAASGSGGTGAAYSSYVFDPATETAREIDRPMMLPTVDPSGRYLTYWAGSVELDRATGLWQPGAGDLYFDAWTDLTTTPASLGPVVPPTDTPTPAITEAPVPAETPTPEPTQEPDSTPAETPTPDAGAAVPTDGPSTQVQAGGVMPQLLPVTSSRSQVRNWIVRWDASGLHLAIWVAEPSSTKIGRLSLFSVDRTTGQVDTNEPLLAADKVMSSVAFDDGHLVYTSAVDGKTYIQTIPAVPPSTVSTPSPTLPGELPSDGVAPETPAPDSTDQLSR